MLEARVLVVDDNQMNRKIIKHLLKKMELVTYEAEGGMQCLDMMEKRRFDIVFLDYLMPDMDGIETMRAIKERGLCDDTPVVLLTADGNIGENDRYKKEGFMAYLSKPVVEAELRDVVVKYIPKERLRGIETEERAEQIYEFEKLPKLEGFDFVYAMNIVKSEEILYKSVIDFYYFIESFPGKVSVLYDAINEEEARALYRIGVHALKSTAAMVGAMSVSKMAELLEDACVEGNVNKICENHQILLNEMELCKKRISVLLPEHEEKHGLKSVEEALPYFDMLKNSLQNYDYNTADVVCKEIDKYSYATEAQEIINEIIEYVKNLEADEAVKAIARLRMKGES